jgi:hypothetical protein
MDAERKTSNRQAASGELVPLQQKIDKFGRLCAACLGWGAKCKQPRDKQEGECACTLAGFLNCHRLALQLYLMSERVVPGVVLCAEKAHEGFAEHIAPILEEYGASISRIPSDAGWLIRPGGQAGPQAGGLFYAKGCDGVQRKSSRGPARWVCTSGELEIVLWEPRACANTPEHVETTDAKKKTGACAPCGPQKTIATADEISVYFEILSAFRAALAPLGLDAHIRVG